MFEADKTDLKIERQEEAVRDKLARLGWPEPVLYVDVESAFNASKVRKNYRRMLNDLTAGKIDAVAVYHPDRLHRRAGELEEFFEVVDAAGVKHFANASGDYDIGTADGRFVLRTLGNVAQLESETKRRRLQFAYDQLARSGKPFHAGKRPFGFEDDKVTPRADEVALIGEAATRILRGESARSVCLDWGARGIVSPSGKPIAVTTLRRMLLNPRLVGVRTHRGEIVRRDDGSEVQGWAPILDRSTWESLLVVLDATTVAAIAGRQHTTSRKHLLTGLVVCAECGGNLVGQPIYKKNGDRVYTYQCAPGGRAGRGCYKTRVMAHHADRVVEEELFVMLAGAPAPAAETEREEALAEVIRVGEARMIEVALLADGDDPTQAWNPAQVAAVTRKIERRVADARAELSRLRRSDTIAEFRHADGSIEERWRARTLEQKRVLLAEFVAGIVVRPASKQGPVFDEDRVRPVWRR